MNTLALCSALNNSYIAFEKDNKIESEIIKSDENYHSLYLVEKIKNTIKNSNLEMKDIDLIGVNIGPGSFTGIRVALTISKVMSSELNIPLVGVNTAEILLKAYDADMYIADARRDMYFIGNKDGIELIYKDKFEKQLNTFKNAKIVCDSRTSKLIENSINYEENDIDLGKIILELVKTKYLNTADKSVFNPMKLKANYIQTPPIF